MLTVATLVMGRVLEKVVSAAPQTDNTPTWFAGWMTAAAAIATASTALIIWRQVVAGNKAVNVANEALKVTQRQHSQSLYTTTETVKARIDANMPRIVVSLPSAARWPPQIPSSALATTFEEARFDEELKSNMDMSRRFVVTVEVEIRNEGEKTTELSFDGPLYDYGYNAYGRADQPNFEAPIHKYTLKPGESKTGAFLTDWDMRQWVKVLEQREGHVAEPDANSLDITYGDSLDTGAHDTQRIILSGTILVRVSGSRELFVVPNAPAVNASVQPTLRKYWLSRRTNQLLPEYTWDSITLDIEADGSRGH